MPPCSITFSPFLAVNAIPSLGVLANKLYWVSDQTVTSEQGRQVRLVMLHFLQPQDAPGVGGMPARIAGHLYGVYKDCTGAGSEDPDDQCPPTGACNFLDGDCCYETTEDFCFGEWKGIGSECSGAELCVTHVCCNIGRRTNCQIMPPSLCQIFGGVPLPDEHECQGDNTCRGACCVFGGPCIDNQTIDQCTAIHDLTGQWARFMGPQSTCDGVNCPEEGACCFHRTIGGCELLSPIECEATGDGVFMGLGTSCNTPGICGGACCHFDPSGGGDCFDVDRAVECAGVDQTWLGPNTSCDTHMGDCGICCLVTVVSGGLGGRPVFGEQNPPGGPLTGWTCNETLSQRDCLARGGTPFGPGAQCEQCDLVRRACCVRGAVVGPIGDPDDPPNCFNTMQCISVRTHQECTALGGHFDPARDCPQTMDCFENNFTGACCCPPPGPGPCECVGDLLRSDCDALSCWWQGMGTVCGEEGSTQPCFIDCAALGTADDCIIPR